MGNCQAYHFSCAGLPDGFNEHPVKRPGPFYIICLQERVIAEGTCPRDTDWQAQMFPYNGKCTHRFAIPTSWFNIGLLPDCSGKADGHYQYPTRPCDVYYKCEGGVATAVKCPPNTNLIQPLESAVSVRLVPQHNYDIDYFDCNKTRCRVLRVTHSTFSKARKCYQDSILYRRSVGDGERSEE